MAKWDTDGCRCYGYMACRLLVLVLAAARWILAW